LAVYLRNLPEAPDVRLSVSLPEGLAFLEHNPVDLLVRDSQIIEFDPAICLNSQLQEGIRQVAGGNPYLPEREAGKLVRALHSAPPAEKLKYWP
jgi:hypothetical protein